MCLVASAFPSASKQMTKVVAALGLLLLALAAYGWVSSPASAIPGTSLPPCGSGERVSCVVDGDTIWLEGINYRLEGYDTPEEYNNVCGGFAEIDLARAATARLVELLNQEDWEMKPVGRSDAHGRVLANLIVDGVDVGDILIREGLARAYPGGDEFWCS